MRIVLAGGGTGGHLFPLIAVARKMKEKLGSDAELLYVGSGARMEKDVMSKEGIPMKFVMSGKIRRYFSLQNVVDFFKLPIGFVQALWILLKWMPDAVFSKGGYVSIPTVLAAWVYRIPILIHESDAIPGIANRFLSNFASRVAVAYPSAEQYLPPERTALIGNPLRENIATGDANMLRKKLEFTESKKVIFVVGGSQGSQVINQAIIRILPQLLEHFQIIHQTGENNYDECVILAAEQGVKAGHEGYFPAPFLEGDDLRGAFALADLIVSRAGATTIAEIAANQKPAILVPLEGSANDHQRLNAYEIAKVGGALVLEETNLGQHILLEKIEKLLADDQLCSSMSQKLGAFHHPDAADIIANAVIELGTL